jgi:dihydrofolate reductase
MRKLIVSTFASLDGIMQAPGGPEEDPTGGFTLGGWMFGYGDESMDISASGFDGKDRELVLGRRTYQIFEAYWRAVRILVKNTQIAVGRRGVEARLARPSAQPPEARPS